MNKKLLDIFYKSHIFKRAYTTLWYELISLLDKKGLMKFMNYGYKDNQEKVKLKKEDENDQCNIALYNHLVKDIDLSNKELLEVSCGRGGGIYYFAKYFKMKRIVGLDLTIQAINFCRKQYQYKNVSFVVGDAQQLPFDDNTFDIIVNLEASGNYPNIEMFFKEVVRVLKPGGYFAYADLRKEEELNKWDEEIEKINLQLIKKKDITIEVGNALDETSKIKSKLINENIPRFLQTQFNEFAGVKDSNYVYNALKNREKVYLSFLFKR